MTFKLLGVISVLMATLLLVACGGAGAQGNPGPIPSSPSPSSLTTLRVVDGLNVNRPTLLAATLAINGQRLAPNERGEFQISNLTMGVFIEASAPGYTPLRTKWRNRQIGVVPVGEIALINETTLPTSFLKEILYTDPLSIDCSEGRLKGRLVPLRRVLPGAHTIELTGEMATDPLSLQHSGETLEGMSNLFSRVGFDSSFTFGVGGKFRTSVDPVKAAGNAGITYPQNNQYGFTEAADVYFLSFTGARYGDVLRHEWGHVIGLGHHCQPGVQNPNREESFPEFSELEEMAIRYLALREPKTRLVLDPVGTVIAEDDTDVALAFAPPTVN